MKYKFFTLPILSLILILTFLEVPVQAKEESNEPDVIKIIGVDDRAKVEDITKTPFSSIAYTQIYIENNMVSRGTSFVVGKNTLLTAAHVAENFLTDYEKQTQSFVAPGRNGSEYPYGKFLIDSVIIHPKYFSSGKMDKYDIAIIKTKPNNAGLNIYDLVPAFPLTNVTEIGNTAFISGYGADKAREQWYHTGNILEIDDLNISYDTDAVGGNSGSPIFNNTAQVIGVHVAGKSKNGIGIRNIGARVSGENYLFIKKNIY